MPRLLIIGLDCAEPSLVFERWRAQLPNLAELMTRGRYGPLESCVPAITVPAWSCMMSGRDPGELGIYGFRNRPDRSYGRMAVADSRAVQQPRLWDILGAAGWRVATVGVPGTFPVTAVNGAQVACFLAPNTAAAYTHPPALAAQIAAWVEQVTPGREYLLDVPDFRSAEKDRILADIYAMCDQRFAVAHGLLRSENPDLLMLVEMGVDRIHHAFWRYMDATSPLYEPDPPYADAIVAYYRHVDQQIGALVAACEEDTAVLVVSDHGARPLIGGFCINEWLQQAGYLTLKEQPAGPVPLEKAAVDWARTRAWGAGGYYGRIFLNVRGREAEGTIAPAEFVRERDALAEALRAIPGPDGALLGNRVFTPQQLYRKVRGIAPDLIVYFGDLAWRTVGQVGGGQLYVAENDTGPDDANHAQHGLIIWADPQRPGSGPLANAQIYDVLPSLLARYGVTAPEGLRGQVLPF
jgi:predicted AlkP superfamily phosphohydrolase/phosphomutase